MSDGPSPWYAVVLTGVLGGVPGAITFWQWWVNRSDKQTERVLSRDERLIQEMDARAATLSKESAAILQTVKAEVVRYLERIAELEKALDVLRAEMDVEAERSRFWYRRAGDVWHMLTNVIQGRDKPTAEELASLRPPPRLEGPLA